jgi:hypothetical protein
MNPKKTTHLFYGVTYDNSFGVFCMRYSTSFAELGLKMQEHHASLSAILTAKLDPGAGDKPGAAQTPQLQVSTDLGCCKVFSQLYRAV